MSDVCERCAQLEKEMDAGIEAVAKRIEEVSILREFNERLIEALKFYADPELYPDMVLEDGGATARIILRAIEMHKELPG